MIVIEEYYGKLYSNLIHQIHQPLLRGEKMNHNLIKICTPKVDVFPEQIQIIDQAGYRYEYEERAAILEYDGGLNRQDAERQAANEITNRLNLKGL